MHAATAAATTMATSGRAHPEAHQSNDILKFPSLMSTPPRLFLIDGSSQMYRAYHAIRGLTGPDGKSTNAVYGFVTMLRKLINDHQPQYIAASFDLAGPTFRDDIVTDYKANRAPMPGDLAEQIPWVHEACEAMGVPILTSKRYEADDVIGTLATKAVGAGLRGRDRHRRQGLLPARPRRHQGLQPEGRRHLVRRRRREGEVRRRRRSRSSTCSR